MTAAERSIEGLTRDLVAAIGKARVLNTLLYGAKIHLESSPRNKEDALRWLVDFKRNYDEVAVPIGDLAQQLIEALQRSSNTVKKDLAGPDGNT